MTDFKRYDKVVFQVESEYVEATVIVEKQAPLENGNLKKPWYVVVYDGDTFAAEEDRLQPLFIDELIH